MDVLKKYRDVRPSINLPNLRFNRDGTLGDKNQNITDMLDRLDSRIMDEILDCGYHIQWAVGSSVSASTTFVIEEAFSIDKLNGAPSQMTGYVSTLSNFCKHVVYGNKCECGFPAIRATRTGHYCHRCEE